MEKLDIIGKNCLYWLHLKNISCECRYSFVCLRCVVPVSVHYRLCLLTFRTNIVRVVKSRRMRWAGHVTRMGENRVVHRVLVGRPKGKRPLGRPRRR
jgi:hypothetical protein